LTNDFERADVTHQGSALQTLTVDVSTRRIATITLNRPDRGNAFDQTMLNELGSALEAFAKDDQVRVVVLRGSGKHFCTGADLASRAAGTAPEALFTLRDVLVALDTLPKPTIAVVHGGAIGGGAGFTGCCDVAVATEAAFFSIPEVRVGMPPLGVMPFLVRAMGHRGFRRYGLSGERMTAQDALRLGLVHQLCDAASLDETVLGIADALLHGAPGALATLKQAAAEFSSPTLAAILADRPKHDPKTPEAQEGVASFREKRKPAWYPQ
jgi:methylglutaconyl-CoA hydratase